MASKEPLLKMALMPAVIPLISAGQFPFCVTKKVRPSARWNESVVSSSCGKWLGPEQHPPDYCLFSAPVGIRTPTHASFSLYQDGANGSGAAQRLGGRGR
jgi:hypothetical protein